MIDTSSNTLPSVQHIARAQNYGDLEPLGAVPRAISDPPPQVGALRRAIPNKGESRAGIWESTAGAFKRTIEMAEVIHVLCGEATFVPEVGPEIRVCEGDTVIFAENTKGIWHVHSTFRKHYVLL